LAFHPYPQLIPYLFNGSGFGPPAGVTQPSAWPWVDHLVSGLHPATDSPCSDSLSLRLPYPVKLVPSTTPFGLALGADSPCADERCAGNLGLSASVLFTRFIATHVSIRTSDTSSIPPGTPSTAYGTLPYHVCAPFNSLALDSN